jgi:hypothetical protein
MFANSLRDRRLTLDGDCRFHGASITIALK